MALKIQATTYVKPVTAEKENPYVEQLEVFASKGVDTAFEVTFTADEYKADKLLIQRAINTLGFSAREVATDWTDEKTGKAPVKSTFLIRPARKRKAGETQEEADAAEAAGE